MANKYQQGKIYKLMSPNADRIYIGSTTNNLSHRMGNHRIDHRKWKSGTHYYMSSFDVIDAGNVSIILIETYPCNSRDELRAREQHHIDLNGDICVNKLRAYRAPEEKHEIQNEKHDCECGGKYLTRHISSHNKTQQHLDFLAGIERVPYDRHEKRQCECGGKYILADRSRHYKSKLHQEFLKKNADANKL